VGKLKLGPIADEKPVRLTIEVPASVHRDLLAYADALRRETSQTVEAAQLVAPMIARFMATDRAFAKARRTPEGVAVKASDERRDAPQPAGEPNSGSA
jgi:hypothetical protein